MDPIDNKTPLIYISGWKGAGKESGTYKWLERHFKNIECYAAGGSIDISKMYDELAEIIAKCTRRYGYCPLLVGNSYGGFLASQFPLGQVLVNPALYPSETLPHITDLTDNEVFRLKKWEKRRDYMECHRRVFCVCSQEDELIPGHRTEAVGKYPPVVIPGGKHRLTDEQRDRYLLPLLQRLLVQEYRIVKISVADPKIFLDGQMHKAEQRTFPAVFPTYDAAERHLAEYIKKHPDVNGKTVIGYKIEEAPGYDKHYVYAQWSFAPDGRLLARALCNCRLEFNGRNPEDSPFKTGDYVLTAWKRKGLTLGVVTAQPPNIEYVEEIKRRAEQWKQRDYGYIPLDSSDDCYIVDYIDEYHDHPSVANVFPIPFSPADIPPEIVTALHWGD